MLVAESTTKSAMAPEEILSLKVLTDSQISPNGQLVAFVAADNFKEEGTAKPHSNIWITRIADGHTTQFSSGPRSDYMPRWSRDGSKLVFLSDRIENGKFQIYLLSTSGGEAIQLTDYKGVGEIMQIEWSRTDNKIAFLMYDPETDEDRKRFEESGGAIEYEKRHKFARIYVMDVSTKKIEWQSSGNYHVWEFAWSPDEKSFAAVVADEPYEWSWHISSLAIISGDNRDVIYTPRPRQIARIMWSPDGSEVYFISAIWSDRGLVAGDLYRAPATGGQQPVNLTNDSLGSVHCYNWYSNEELMIVSVSGRERNLLSSTLYRASSLISTKETSDWSTFSSRNFQFLLLIRAGEQSRSSGKNLHSPVEVWSGEVDPLKDKILWKKLSDFNKDLKEKYTSMRVDLLEWDSFDGFEIPRVSLSATRGGQE